ncbi:MAG: ABC transporter permease [Acidobacteria bacterium]|nr:ABC transporter permease [Acidobacteriota bacterium]
MRQTLRPAWRALARRPGFTAVAILILALGIGANAAIFSVIDAVLLRPLPYEDPSRLVIVWQHNAEAERRLGFERLPMSPADFVDFHEGHTSFDGLASMRGERLTLTEGAAERVGAIRVSTDFFSVLGIPAAWGRTFTPGDAQHGRAVVMAHTLWVRRFGADPLILNRTVSFNGEPAVVTGVMPPGFTFPAAGDLPEAFGFTATPEVWTLDILSPQQRANRGGKSHVLVGRLAPGTSLAAADADLGAIAEAIARESPGSNAGWTVRLVPLREQLVARVRPPLLVLLTAVGFVLLIACANVANLLLVRATTRQRELTVRLALGASRRRIVAELLAESLVLAVAAGGAGLVVAWWTLQGLVMASPANLPAVAQATLDLRVLLFTLSLSILTGFVFGMIPALHATGTGIVDGLRDGGRGAVGSRRGNRLRGLLVIGEVALAVVLLVGAALLIQAFVRLTHVDAGFSAERVLTMELALSPAAYGPAEAGDFFERLLERLESLPGVEAAGATSGLPLTGNEHIAQVTIDGAPPPEPGHEMVADYRTVTNGYFTALRIPVHMGSLLPDPRGPEGPRYALVNQRLARTAWPGQDPIGRRLKLARHDVEAPWHIVTGVVGDTRHTALELELRPQVYTHQRQYPDGQMALLIRTAGDPGALAPSARATVAALDPAQPLSRMRPMADVLAGSVAERRFHMFIVGIFAALAVLLALVGLYAVIAYSVAERIHEMGVRLALGARPSSLLALVLGDGMKLIGTGLLLGLVAAVLLTRLLESQLYGVDARDVTTFVAVPTALAAVGMLGCLVPAMRAMRVDPAAALRSE